MKHNLSLPVCTPVPWPGLFGDNDAPEAFSTAGKVKYFSAGRLNFALLASVLLSFFSVSVSAQLSGYTFSGTASCPNVNNTAYSQPANAIFSPFTSVGGTCVASNSSFVTKDLNTGSSIDLNEYNTFTITPNSGYLLSLTTLLFTHVTSNVNGTTWALRSNLDNYTTNIATGSASIFYQTPVINLPGTFTNTGAVTFRFYLIKIKGNSDTWSLDNVTLYGQVNQIPADPSNPTSNSPQCNPPGVTLTRTGTPPFGQTWYWQNSATGTSTSNSGTTYNVTTSATYYIRALNTSTQIWSTGAGSLPVNVTQPVGPTSFAAGASSSRCQGGNSVSYAATAANAAAITYTLDNTSLSAGNKIDAATGNVTYTANWTGTSTVTARATGCGPANTATHTVTTIPSVTTPVFSAGASSARCQNSGTVAYTATAFNATGLTYSLDAASIAGGNSINAGTGAVNYSSGWSGTTIITASAAGCNGPLTAKHTVIVTGTVGTPIFVPGNSSTRCQGAATVNYAAPASNAATLTYALDGTSISSGNSINTATGDVTYVAGWTGTSRITATATGCNGSKTATHTVTITPSVTTPVFDNGAGSVVCQAPGRITYTANASNTTGITYSIDSASEAAGNFIRQNGQLTYTNTWTGTTVITASAAGCNGPAIATHTVTIVPTVGTPVFNAGTSSVRCQAAGKVSYPATATNTTGISYSLDFTSRLNGNSINAATGEVTYVASWTGTSVITASADGCYGPVTSDHTVTTTTTVGTPAFAAGASSVICQNPGSITYTATASNSTALSYGLDAASIAGGNVINSSTGALIYAPSWTGTTVITATATGCNGPATSKHTVTITPSVSNPVFAAGAGSTRCQGAGTVTYTATANNTTGYTYSLDNASVSAGNSIVPSTGAVTYAAGWSGTTVITVSVAGCNGPGTAQHTVTVTPDGTPVFALGASSTRCQMAGTKTYTATATNGGVVTYSLDAASVSGGNSINPSTGVVTFAAAWTGTSKITATATGCNGQKASMHTVTILPNGTPSFVLGGASSRMQGAGTGNYSATANNGAAITYSLDAASLAAGNTINATTGDVTFTAIWSNTTIVTATANGCNGTVSATHTITINSDIVIKQLYLSDPSQSLDRNDPVATNDNTTAVTGTLGTSGNYDVIAIDNNASGSVTGATTLTISNFVTGTGKNRFMLVGIASDATVNSVTYAGQSFTRVQSAGSASPRTDIWKLMNPPSVSGNVLITCSAAGSIKAGVTTFTGVNQTNPYRTPVTTGTGNSTPAVTLSSSANELVYDVAGIANNPTATAGTGQTQLWNLNTANTLAGGGSTKTGAPSVTMSWTTSTSPNPWTQVALSLQPSPASASNTSFTQLPVLCSPLTVKAGKNLTVSTYISLLSGTMPASPSITATVRYGTTNIIVLANPVYNSSTNILTWTGTLSTDVTVPADQAISLDINTTQPAVDFVINYDSKTSPSRIDLPVSTYIAITSLDIYTAPYPGGKIINSAVTNSTNYIRATATDPFGYSDITGIDYTFTPSGGTVTANPVSFNTCTRTYEYTWNSTAATGSYNILAKAKEGYENSVTAVKNTNLYFCTSCPPVAVNDSAVGAGGSPLLIDVMANDYDPNNNINTASLVITRQPQNGSALLSGNKVVYLPNGIYTGKDTLAYQICDNTSPTPLCATGQVFLSIDPTVIDPCSDAAKSHLYYIPYPEQDARTALLASATQGAGYTITNIRTIISLKMPYPNMKIIWDQWEDGYESNIQNPQQSTTLVWGDGNPYNGIAPGYSNDIIPAGGSIVLDNTMPCNPRVAANIFYDGKDKIYSSGQITITQALGEPTYFGVQAMKTNVSSTTDFGLSFTIPVGQNFNSQDFKYTALFIRASEDNTVVNIDKDNNGVFETTATLNQGQSLLVNGGVLNGAVITGSAPIGVDLHFGGVDLFSSREAPIYPATWYSNTYYTPVPTTHSPDTAVVMLYNSLSRPINIKWNSGAPANGVIMLPAKTVVRFPLALSATATYKFFNPTGEAFTAIEIVDSYTPGGGGNDGSTFDWAFNLISQERLTTFATIAWAPGSTDGTRDDNPIWVTPANNTTIYVKYNGDVLKGGSTSPCGLHYDVSYPLSALTYKRILDLSDKDQSGLAVFTCDGTKIAAVYGEDPSTAQTANPSWDVGSTIQPFCALKLILANDDNAFTMTNHPVTIDVLKNDVGFQATVDPSSILLDGYLQPKHGTVAVNANGTLLYTPNPGYIGLDSLEYNVCSTPSPIVCDEALVIIKIDACPTPTNQNIISGQVFLDKNKDGLNNDGGNGFYPGKVYLYDDANCSGALSSSQLKDSVILDRSGGYQFITYPEKTAADDFDNPAGTSTCASGSDGTVAWLSNWADAGDPSVGFCVTPAQSYANTNAEIIKDGNFGYALRLKNPNVSATRTVNLSGSTAAYLTFSYRRTATSMTAGKNILVQASANGSTFTTVFTIAGNGTTDADYVTVYNQNILPYASANTYLRFLTSSNFGGNDTVFIDKVSITYLKYPQCYITKVDPSNVVPNYYFTTASQNALTATSGGTCLFPFDFGVASASMVISGTVYDDANGLTDSVVNGVPVGKPSGITLYAYLIDSTGKIALKTTVNATTGTYSFPLANVYTRYTLMLSTIDSALYASPPASANLPTNWASTGETYGTANGAGTGNEPGSPNSSISVYTSSANISQVNFGIEKLPVAGGGFNAAINPGGTKFYTIPPTTFVNIKNSSDVAAGFVTGIRLTVFPNNANVLVINGTSYNRYNFPAEGVYIPANTSGQPAQTIMVDPYDGFVKIVLNFYTVDNAGKESPVQGAATVQFLTDTDGDGVADVDDIDDDNDGIPDVVEICGAGAVSFSCLPGGSDPSKDDDGDGIVNYKDAKFGALNAAGCVAALDTDSDGIPDFLDKDSDNDGIPDVVEAFGVDTDGDGVIDNFTDTDGDGLSQNVDANNSGAAGSGQGLGFKDFDRDGIPNTRDLDSDNDGIPDVVEAGGRDVNNEGRADGFIDADADGLNDVYERLGALIITGPDNDNNGTADYYPNKNTDQMRYPNPYDIDSDGDGITDAIEAGFPNSVSISNGRVTGISSNGWANSVQALTSLILRNTDGRGPENYLDIDSDDDGISDNIEGQSTFSYVVPGDIDSDGDGLADVYDISPLTFGGSGITPYDHDYDGIPDYIDTDTDNDGAPDINEASKLSNLNQASINTNDADGDGMLDEFDNIDMNTLAQGSRYKNVSNSQMGAGGSFDGPLPTGSNVKLVRSQTSGDRDWRSSYVLPLTIVSFAGTLHENIALLSWNAENETDISNYVVERSKDGVTFEDLASVTSKNAASSFYTYDDDLSNLAFEVLYYRIRQVNKNGDVFYTRIISVKKHSTTTLQVTLHPNPVAEALFLGVQSASRQTATVFLYNAAGKPVIKKTYKLEKGENSLRMDKLGKLAAGVYMLQIVMQENSYVEKIIKE